jgi:hypothetical protein
MSLPRQPGSQSQYQNDNFTQRIPGTTKKKEKKHDSKWTMQKIKKGGIYMKLTSKNTD